MTGKLDKCSHGRYGYEGCEQCAADNASDLREALLVSTTMLEALLVQLNSWGHESAVNARGQIFRNEELLAKMP